MSAHEELCGIRVRFGGEEFGCSLPLTHTGECLPSEYDVLMALKNLRYRAAELENAILDLGRRTGGAA